jgi:hypothetical protein
MLKTTVQVSTYKTALMMIPDVTGCRHNPRREFSDHQLGHFSNYGSMYTYLYLVIEVD